MSEYLNLLKSTMYLECGYKASLKLILGLLEEFATISTMSPAFAWKRVVFHYLMEHIARHASLHTGTIVLEKTLESLNNNREELSDQWVRDLECIVKHNMTAPSTRYQVDENQGLGEVLQLVESLQPARILACRSPEGWANMELRTRTMVCPPRRLVNGV